MEESRCQLGDRAHDGVRLGDGVARREARVRDRDAHASRPPSRSGCRCGSPRPPRRRPGRPRGGGPPRGRRPGPAFRGSPPRTRRSPRTARRSRRRSSTRSISSRFDDEARPSVYARGDPPDGLERAGHPRRPCGVPLEHPRDDQPVDLVGRLRQARSSRACSATIPASSCPSSPAARRGCQRPPRSRGELLADLVPDLLGVDQHAVQVEDHARRSQRQRTSGRGRRASRRPARARALRTSPTKNMWSPVSSSATVRRRSSRPRPASSRGSSSRTGMPSQSAIGGTLRAKCCAR